MGQDLLTRAVQKAGSARALATLIEQHETAISNWKRGRPIPDEVIAWLAEYVGEDPLQSLAKEKGGLWKKIAASTTAALLLGTTAISDESYTKSIENKESIAFVYYVN